MRTALLTALALLPALHAFGQTTTIDVPQGSGPFPTVGQINCLEEVGGRYCSATWECGGESGDLWGDMANNNGRRSLDTTSPVARSRDCTIEVDGAAEAVWFTAFTPAGRDAAPIGLSAVANPTPATVRRVVADAEGSGSFLDWVIGAHDINLAAELNKACGHIKEGDEFLAERRECLGSVRLRLYEHSHWRNTAATRCVADLIRTDVEAAGYRTNTVITVWWGGAVHMHRRISEHLSRHSNCNGIRAFATDDDKLAECCTLYIEEAERVGFAFE